MKLFSRLVARNQTFALLRDAGSIGVALGGEEAARQVLDTLR